MPDLVRELPRRPAALSGPAWPAQQPFDVPGIDERYDQWIMLINLHQLAVLTRIVAGADQSRELTRLLQATKKEIGDYGSGVGHEGSLVVAPLFCPPDEILRAFEALGELAVDQLGYGTPEQYRRLLANGAIARAKLECTRVGAIDVRIGPPCVGGVRHRQIGLQG